jgi:hypothetical protein
MAWYTIVHAGSDPQPAKGPFKSVREAEAAIGRFQDRHGSMTGTYLAAGSTRLVGPFQTKREALQADISTSAILQRFSWRGEPWRASRIPTSKPTGVYWDWDSMTPEVKRERLSGYMFDRLGVEEVADRLVSYLSDDELPGGFEFDWKDDIYHDSGWEKIHRYMQEEIDA